MRRVVITGVGAVSPVGNTAEETWSSLIAGKSGIGPITHFDTSDPACKVKLAAEVKDFDPSLYMEKGDIRKSDLYSQYAMAAAVQAMQDSGLEGNIDSQRLGVYVGSGIGGMDTFVDQCNTLEQKGMKRISPFFIPMMISNMAAGNIAIRFKAKGPSMCVTTACATSAHAIGEAFHTVAHGYADAMIAGGAEATINKLAVAGFTNCKALTTEEDPNRASIPFDKERSGFVMGEGGAVLVLEEYEHAKARGAKIYAEIVGYGNTNDAYHMTAPEPNAEGSAKSIELAVQEAGMPADAVLYINAHGTSTPLNDKTETLAIKKALGEEAAHKAMVSSTKSMTGHMLGATGALEAMACAYALRDGVVPPTINYREPDPECDLDYVPNEARKADIEYAITTNLGFGGHNACLVLKKI
ncbi:MAG TPA: beta-ketoacyl-ACP synthase II [Firmicutes bacterium]|nr:beta-ketoacyl-ACP synthase II [Bacillota bacterium]